MHDDSLIGSGSVLLHRVTVGPESLVGAGAVVSPGTTIPAHARALGVPARVVENVVQAADFRESMQTYVRNAAWYLADLRRLDP